MKSFDSRVYSVNDFREWQQSDQLVLSPRFQRREVWTDTARSYLMDTIARGKPVPKIFLRQRIDPKSGKSIREVIDGQQRLRTILAYVSDGLQISRKHNPDYAGKYFSQLDEDKRLAILNYELSTDLLINVSDPDVLDIFSRLNAHAVVLNEQERLNATHFSEFKQLADNLAHANFDYWVANKILSDSNVMRMGDVSLTADLLIAMIEGVQSKKQVKSYYTEYEKLFVHNVETLYLEFNQVLRDIELIFPEGLKNTEYYRIHLYYSLFTAFYHLRFGLKGLPAPAVTFDSINPQQLRFSLDRIDAIFTEPDVTKLGEEDRQFLNDSRRATTDASVRERRTKYLVKLALEGQQQLLVI